MHLSRDSECRVFSGELEKHVEPTVVTGVMAGIRIGEARKASWVFFSGKVKILLGKQNTSMK